MVSYQYFTGSFVTFIYSVDQKHTFLEDENFLAASVDVTGLDELGNMIPFGDLVALPSSGDHWSQIEEVPVSIIMDTPALGCGRQHWGQRIGRELLVQGRGRELLV